MNRPTEGEYSYSLSTESAPVLNRLTPAVIACLLEFSALYDSLEVALEGAILRHEREGKADEANVSRELKLETRKLHAGALRALHWNRQRVRFGSRISVEETEETFDGVAQCLQTITIRLPMYCEALSTTAPAALENDTGGKDWAKLAIRRSALEIQDWGEVRDRLANLVRNWLQALPESTVLINIASVPFADVELVQRGNARCWLFHRNDDAIAKLREPAGEYEAEVALKFAEASDFGPVTRDVTVADLRSLSWFVEEDAFVDTSGLRYVFHVSQKLTLAAMPEPKDTWRRID